MLKALSITRDHTGLLLLLATFLALALAWNAVIPAYENLDEIEHVEVIRHIAITGQLPIHGEAEKAGFHVRQEASQPPLYHLLGAVWLRLWDLPVDPPTAEPIPETLIACGSGNTRYNRVTWSRNPYAGFPWEGHRRTTHFLRLLSTLLQCATIAGTWTLAHRLAPRGPIALLATAIVAFNPQFLLIAAGVNNDNLVTPLATWALVLLLDNWQRGLTRTRLLGFGVLTGMATLSKLSGLGLLGLGGLVLLMYAWQHHVAFTQLLRWGLFLAFPALMLITPWLVRNWQIYGDPTALAPMLEVVGRTAVRVDIWGTFQLMLRSYWGQLPCAFYPRAFYWPFFLLVAGGFLGIRLRSLRDPRRRAVLLILVGWFSIIIAAWIRWNALTPATGGRLLFPAAPALAVILAAGWQRFGSWVARLWIICLPLLATITLLMGVAPLFAPPARLSALPADAVVSGFSFGADAALRLEGYEIQQTSPHPMCWLLQPGDCHPALEITLYMKATRPLNADWAMAVQIVSAQPGNDTLRLTYDAWPGHGNLPTSAWPAGPLLREHLRLPLLASDLPTQAWDVQLVFYDPGTKTRVPVTGKDQVMSDAARLRTLRIEGKQPLCETLSPLRTSVRFGEAIALTHSTVATTPDGWEVTLCWESRVALDADYTIFVHAYAADGTLLGTGDGPPMELAFPTHLWLPGDHIRDAHVLTVTEMPATIAVGLYNPETGVRLPAFAGPERQANDAIALWP